MGLKASGAKRGKTPKGLYLLMLYGAPAATRTRDHLLRRQMLYPTELRALTNKYRHFVALIE